MRAFPPRVGEPLFDRKKLVALLIPLIIEQILSAAIGIADSIMVARVGEYAMSGVSIVDAINILLINVFAALSTGGTIVTAQYIGQGKKDSAKESACQAMIVTIGIAALVMVVCVFFRSGILHAIYGDVDENVMDSALIYFLITALSYPFMSSFNTCSAIFRATGDAKRPMMISVGMNVLNVCGNAIFIFVCGLGAAGAALATLISRIVGAAVIAVMLYSEKREINIHGLFPLRLNLPMVKNILRVGVPTGFENGIFQIGKVLVQSIITTFGTVGIAAASVANNVASFTAMPGLAIGIGLVTVVGQCIGAGKQDQAKRYTVGFTALAIAVAFVLTVFLYFFADTVIGFFGVSAETAALAKKLIFSTLIANTILWPPAFVLPNALRAAGDVRYTMIIAVASMWIFRVLLGYIFAIVLDFGVIGVWYGMITDWLARTIAYVARYLSDRWTRHKVVT
jgi:putative MATE family efflux protein